MSLQRETWQGGDADAGSDQRLHDDDVVAVRTDAGSEAHAFTHRDKLGLTSGAPAYPARMAVVGQMVVGSPADEVDPVVTDVQEAEALVVLRGVGMTKNQRNV